MTKLVVMEGPENAGRKLTIEQPVLGTDIHIHQETWNGNDTSTVHACRDADVVLTDYVPFALVVLQQLPQLKLISVAASGYDNIDIAAAREQGIRVCAIDEYCTDEVADHALLLMLALGRRLIGYHEQVQNQRSWQYESLTGLPRFGDLTLGIIGFGRIGRAVARRAEAFGMSVMAHDPFVEEASFSLDEIFEQSDIITLHCNLSAENRRLIDKAAFRKMRRKPILINVARGGLIAENDLVWALEHGHVSAAGLDVLEQEPPDLTRSALTGRSNVILTPHVAFYSDASIRENRRLSAQNIRHFLDGKHDAVRKYVGNT